MTSLDDGCLLHVFHFLDPITWVSISQVCTRWEQLALIKLNKITEIYIQRPENCNKIPMGIIKMTRADKSKLHLALQYIGPYVRSVKLSDLRSKMIIFNRRYSYYVSNIMDTELILMMSRTCKNIEILQFAGGIDVEQLLISNKNLKKVIFSENNLNEIFLSHSLDSVEEVSWKVQTIPRFFNWSFPNVRKLSLFINCTILFRAELILKFALQRSKTLKSLSILINTSIPEKYHFTMLSNISALVQLEELRINAENYLSKPQNLNFQVDSVKELVSSCQNLRIVKFDGIGLGSANVSEFFKLPRLEELTVVKASSFVPDCPSGNLVNLTKLEINFELKNDGEKSPCLCDIIEKIPALKYLKVDGITQEEASHLTCRAITIGLLRDKDVFIKGQAPNDSMKVYKTVNSAFKSEPLKLWIKPQKRDYVNDINEVVKNLQYCLLVKDEFEVVEQEDNLFKQYTDTYTCCVKDNDEFNESDVEYEDYDGEYYDSNSLFDDQVDPWDDYYSLEDDEVV